MQNDPQGQPEPANLRFLRILVTVLTITMIAGLLTIIALLVIRFTSEPRIALPDEITVPGGANASAFTQGRDWYAIVTDQDEIIIYDRASGDIRKTLSIK
ncbi:DUF6476 family protein [Qingshengfaniella alkalisoli]|uniref:Uncharacterized protein n=1 Tax=Qingshengfaniella alkalisoli TaxID=2599296 RepID=A0A5B8J7D4_9RHOB|nr:DUF6476 family protein [Qingshengfaniella alkalisoli]QDY70260.1 hypothetical protein FPZ52_06220 [Qingshengfaniella alkalisoli]